MSKFIVTVRHNGEKWPLKGTVWAFSMEALQKAKPFMKAAIFKKAEIEEVSE